MTAFDYCVLAVMALSIALSIWRGFLRELLSLAAWVAAFLGATLLAADVARVLPMGGADPTLRLLAAMLLLFVGILIVGSIIALLLSMLIKKAGLDVIDRLLGAVFGAARGLILVLILVLIGGLTVFPSQPFWKNAMFSPPLEAAALAVAGYLPAEVREHIKYRPTKTAP
jgi:membrane protein required for colicin V production